MSPPNASSPGLSNSCGNAEVRLVLARRLPKSNNNYKLAHVDVSSRIYWKLVNKDATNKFQSLSDFCSAGSLEVYRLDERSWENVDETVKVDTYEGKARITVPGRLYGRNLLSKLFTVSDVKLEIIAKAPEQHELWVDKIRARIAPWNVLQQEMKDASGAGKLEEALGSLTNSVACVGPSSTSTENAEEKLRDKLVKLPEKLQKLSIVEKLTTHSATALGLGGTVDKLAAGAERVSETAEFLADLSKCVGGFSTIFQLVSIGAQGVLMCVDASRDQKVLPAALAEITILLRYILEILAQMMKSSQTVKETATNIMFDALKETMSIMDMAEAQILRGPISQIMSAEDAKKVEKKLEELTRMAVIAGNTSRAAENASKMADNSSRICAVGEKVNRLEEGRENWCEGPHHVRPSLSAFFSGRQKELKTLRHILENWGSAAITQYGGAGKTELMVAFAEQAEQDEQVPGGVFWVTVDGDVRDVIGSLAGLAEKLTGRKMREDERQNANLVMASLKQELSEREGRWLLCLENADDSKVSGILDQVCGMVGPSQSNGWVVVNSRQGQPPMWDRMKSEQKLNLEPLCAEEAMVLLWRKIYKIERSEADDGDVMKEIEELECVDQAEYCALKKLCGDDSGHGLGGLPLALIQAGSFIAQFKYSFAKYLDLFEDANRIEDIQSFMENAGEVTPIQDTQRLIWTTWKINVEKLSGKAYRVLRAMAMLGRRGIGEVIVNGILEATGADGGGNVETMLRNVIVQELMHESSLIWCSEEDGEGKKMYNMNRLVRQFILSGMSRGSAVWKDVYSLALHGVHQRMVTLLDKDGDSFNALPDVYENYHLELATHSLALVHHHVLPTKASENRGVSAVSHIHQYSGMVLDFMGRWEEEAEVWEHLLTILHYQKAENRSGRGDKVSSGIPHHEDRGNELESIIADVYNYLGNALIATGKFNSAASKLEQSLNMRRAIYGQNKPHLAIASSLYSIGNMYERMGKLNEALEKKEQSFEIVRAIHGHNKPHPHIASFLHKIGNLYEQAGKLNEALRKYEQSLQMRRAIYGNNKPHINIALSLSNIGNVYKAMGKLDEALQKHEECLDMRRAIHGHNKPHPHIASSLNNIGNVYEKMGKLNESLEKYEQSFEIVRAIKGRNKPHPDIASSLNNIGNVFERMGKLDEALRKHKQSLQMKRAIYGHNKPHPRIASSLNNIGIVYKRMGNLNEALRMHEQSLEMGRTIHVHNRSHPDIASSLYNIGNVYLEMGKLDEALEKHKQSIEMKLSTHGHGKPLLGIAVSLWCIGQVYHKQMRLNHAADFLEQSLRMLRTVHGRSSSHLHILTVVSELNAVYEEQGRGDEPSRKKRRVQEEINAQVIPVDLLLN